MIKVVKRNGKEVRYDGQRVVNAILGAMRDVGDIDEDIAYRIENEIRETLSNGVGEATVDEISDAVEESLMRNGATKIAKTYILYRADRDKSRKLVNSQERLLTDDFISKYKHIDPPMTEIGEFVYYRTYSRWLPEYNRREFWWETVRRSVEYNCSLLKTSRKEAEELFDNIFNLRQFLSGRTFWVGGTEVAEKYAMSNYNCSFQTIDSFDSFKDIFYLLMIGSGAGVRVLKEDVSKLPKIRTNLNVLHLAYSPVPINERIESTSLQFEDDIIEIVVADSKEGWCQALDFYLKIRYANEYKYINTIIMNYNNVRPNGERLKTFGGTASGHSALLEMFKKIDKLLDNKNEDTYKLKPIDCLDIANMIGEGVVVGGVRRTSEVILVDSDDAECIEAKSKLYTEKNGKWEIDKSIIHRQMSNNSIYYTEKPTREKLHWQITQMRYSGEPAWINAEEGHRRRPNFAGGNPCMEIILDSKGLCNLTTVNVFAFVKDGVLDIEGLLKAQRLSSRASYRMTCVDLELPLWDQVQKRDKLMGCSLTGWQDMVNATGMTRNDEIELLKRLKLVANEEADKLTAITGDNRPLLICTVKPEGTLSQLPSVSSGVHYSHSPYFIRRVRINSQDPLVKVGEEIGYPIKPEVGQDWDTCKTKVVEFPVKSPNGKTKYDVSAIEQLENYIMFQKYYTEHNTSITVHVRDHEWDEVEQFVWDNWDDILAVSFLSLDDSFYELLPYEAITEEEYIRRKSEISNSKITPYKIAKYEKFEQAIDIGTDGCDNGVCPVR